MSESTREILFQKLPSQKLPLGHQLANASAGRRSFASALSGRFEELDAVLQREFVDHLADRFGGQFCGFFKKRYEYTPRNNNGHIAKFVRLKRCKREQIL